MMCPVEKCQYLYNHYFYLIDVFSAMLAGVTFPDIILPRDLSPEVGRKER